MDTVIRVQVQDEAVCISHSANTFGEKYASYYVTGGGARDVIVIVVGSGHGVTSSNPGRD